MTLSEWTAKISAELRAAGFTVTEYSGFPLVQPSMAGDANGHLERVKLLGFRTSLQCERRIYAEGMLFVPVEARSLPRV
ncbi:MAG TPA: hypothetical protein VGG46_03870 [Terriglobales bacterium]